MRINCSQVRRSALMKMAERRRVGSMFGGGRAAVLAAGWMLAGTALGWAVEPSAAAVTAFNAYLGRVERRLAEEHRHWDGFLVGTQNEAARVRLRAGETIIEKLTPAIQSAPGATIYDWRGTAFVAGAKGEDFDRVMRNFSAYPQTYAPQVERARVVGQDGDRLRVTMRVRQKHVITVVMDTDYDVVFGRLDEGHGYSVSRSTGIKEIEGAGTNKERALSGSQEHGFLWRLTTYWSYEERDGGLYMQIESVSLARAIPAGLGWAIGPFVESVPKESLEFTLEETRAALRKK